MSPLGHCFVLIGEKLFQGADSCLTQAKPFTPLEFQLQVSPPPPHVFGIPVQIVKAVCGIGIIIFWNCPLQTSLTYPYLHQQWFFGFNSNTCLEFSDELYTFIFKQMKTIAVCTQLK